MARVSPSDDLTTLSNKLDNTTDVIKSCQKACTTYITHMDTADSKMQEVDAKIKLVYNLLLSMPANSDAIHSAEASANSAAEECKKAIDVRTSQINLPEAQTCYDNFTTAFNAFKLAASTSAVTPGPPPAPEATPAETPAAEATPPDTPVAAATPTVPASASAGSPYAKFKQAVEDAKKFDAELKKSNKTETYKSCSDTQSQCTERLKTSKNVQKESMTSHVNQNFDYSNCDAYKIFFARLKSAQAQLFLYGKNRHLKVKTKLLESERLQLESLQRLVPNPNELMENYLKIVIVIKFELENEAYTQFKSGWEQKLPDLKMLKKKQSLTRKRSRMS